MNAYARTAADRRRRSPLPFIMAAALLIAVGIGAFLFIENRTFTITVNGTSHELKGKHTLASLVIDGLANPQPGNLIALDGSILEQGKGDLFEAVIDGSVEHDHGRVVKDGEAIMISDGKDVTEPVEEKIEAVPFEIQEQGNGPIHVIEGEGLDGSRTIKKGTISGIERFEETAAPQHMICKKYFPDTQGEKIIALTFDDGPWKDSTAQVLDVLAEHKVKATFFTLGELIDQPHGADLVKRASDEGHQICTHTYSHARGKGNSIDLGIMPPEEQIAEIEKGLEAIENVTGKTASKVIRTPGGNFKPNTQKLLYPYITAEIGWTIDTVDWKQPGVERIAAEIEAAGPGAIVLMHDGGGHRAQTVDALKKAIPTLKEQGYRFVTIDELLQCPPRA